MKIFFSSPSPEKLLPIAREKVEGKKKKKKISKYNANNDNDRTITISPGVVLCRKCIVFTVRPARTFGTFCVTTRTHTMNEKRDAAAAVANAVLVAKSVIIKRFGHPVASTPFITIIIIPSRCYNNNIFTAGAEIL